MVSIPKSHRWDAGVVAEDPPTNHVAQLEGLCSAHVEVEGPHSVIPSVPFIVATTIHIYVYICKYIRMAGPDVYQD